MMKWLGLLCHKAFSILAHFKEMLHHQNQYHPIHIHRCFIENDLHIVIHLDNNFAWYAEMEGHPKVFMDLTMCDSQWCNFSISFVQVSNKLIQHCVTHMIS